MPTRLLLVWLVHICRVFHNSGFLQPFSWHFVLSDFLLLALITLFGLSERPSIPWCLGESPWARQMADGTHNLCSLQLICLQLSVSMRARLRVFRLCPLTSHKSCSRQVTSVISRWPTVTHTANLALHATDLSIHKLYHSSKKLIIFGETRRKVLRSERHHILL